MACHGQAPRPPGGWILILSLLHGMDITKVWPHGWVDLLDDALPRVCLALVNSAAGSLWREEDDWDGWGGGEQMGRGTGMRLPRTGDGNGGKQRGG
jgi:hypothetical protein